MKPELTIIIPCYNCAKTLKEAVDSCYTQGLSSFEIVMVDDGSTDNTRDVMKKLANEHDNIKTFSHEKNKGGGATRNTAVENARADVIFCLDSDDILPPNTLKKMLKYMREKKCDGVAFSGAYSFSMDKDKYKRVGFALPNDKPISLDYLFSGKAWIGGNFLYTKEAFEKAGGYPTDHPFDTQGYGFRFLTNGLSAYPCPDTFLYQRQFGKDISYFERAYNAGEFSIGHYLMFLENIHVFSEKIRNIIVNYDIFTKYTFDDNILSELQKEYKKDHTSFFSKPAKRDSANDPESEYQRGRFKEAFDLFTSSGKRYGNMYFDGIRYMYGVLNDSKMTIDDYRRLMKENGVAIRNMSLSRPTISQRIKRRIRRYLKKRK